MATVLRIPAVFVNRCAFWESARFGLYLWGSIFGWFLLRCSIWVNSVESTAVGTVLVDDRDTFFFRLLHFFLEYFIEDL